MEPSERTATTDAARAEAMRRRGLDPEGGALRSRAARGAVVNALFMIGLAGLTLTRGFVVAIFVGSVAYGLWGILMVSLGTLVQLRDIGIGDKFIQQDEEDQVEAFQKAFTMELVVALGSMVVLGALLPVFAVIYGRTDFIGPALVVLLMLPAMAFAAPVWIYYRQMRFVRQRLMQAIDPVVGFVVTVVLAAAGAGVWAFVLGAVAGAWSLAAVAVASSPVPLRLRYDRGTLRSYVRFSWPLLMAGASVVVLAQSSAIATNAHLGIAALGAVALAANITQFTTRVQWLVEAALYPAVCAVKDRADLLRESFLKSNRLGMMWGMPFGIGLALFVSDLVEFGIGDEWRPAIELLQISGVVAALAQVCFNWDAYFRALGNTRPIAIHGWAAAITFLVVGIPLLLAFDLRGLALGIAAQAAAALAVRLFYVKRLFGDLHLLRHALSGLLPVIPGTAIVLLLRVLETGDRTLVQALVELVLFVGVTALATWRADGALLREFRGYLRREGATSRAEAPASA